MNGRNCSNKCLISNLYLCLGERGQDKLRNRKPYLDLTVTQYPRVLDEFESVFKKERNETFETCQLLSRKQREGETLETFHSVLSGLAASCALGNLERRILRDVIIIKTCLIKRHKQNSVVQLRPQMRSTELLCNTSGGTNTQKKTYKVSGGGLPAAPAGSLQIKTEPINAIRGGYRGPFQRGGQGFGRGNNRGGGGADRQCSNCAKCPARNATCNFCRKTGRYERTCQGRRTANRGRVG